MKCAIISGGTAPSVAFLKNAVKDCDFIICADLGLEHASKAGITADIAVGDFDSGAVLDNCKRLVRLPVQKDDTDTMSAARLALESGATQAVLLCCTGTRFDHTYANLFVLDFLRRNGVDARIIDEHNTVFLVDSGKLEIEKERKFLSLLPFCSQAKGVSISGVKYPLENADLGSDFPIGVSNEITRSHAQLSIESGTLAVILSDD